MAGGFGDGIFISIWTLWLNDLHASNSFVGLTFVIFSLPLMVLMPFTGKLADKYRLAPLVTIPGVLISFVYLAYGFLTNLPLIAAIGIIEGTLLSISIPAQGAYVANLSPDNARGKLQGVITTARTVAGFLSSLLTAILYGMGMMYPWLALFAVQIFIAVAGGSIVWYIEKRTQRGECPDFKGGGSGSTAQAACRTCAGDSGKVGFGQAPIPNPLPIGKGAYVDT